MEPARGITVPSVCGRSWGAATFSPIREDDNNGDDEERTVVVEVVEAVVAPATDQLVLYDTLEGHGNLKHVRDTGGALEPMMRNATPDELWYAMGGVYSPYIMGLLRDHCDVATLEMPIPPTRGTVSASTTTWGWDQGLSLIHI